MIQMPTPRQTAPVPVKSTGTSWAIQQNRAVIEALKRVEVIVDCTVEGLIHAPEWPEIEASGNTRLLVVCNEHPEILERTEPTAELGAKVALGVEMLRAASTMRVSSAVGTDLLIDLRGAPAAERRASAPSQAMWRIGRAASALPFRQNAVNGRIVMDVGDMNLTFKTALTSRIDFTVENDFVTAIKGEGIDAIHFREYMEAWDDKNAYGMSHVGWGMHPRARWVSAAMYDKRDMQAVEFRALAGSFLWSTGANQYAGRYTLGHFDLPMRNCTIELDGRSS